MVRSNPRTLLPVTPAELQWLVESGYALLGLGRHAAALEVFAGAAELARETIVPELGRVRALREMGRVAEAASVCEAAAARAGRCGEEASHALAVLAELTFAAGRHAEALTLIRSAIDAAPLSPSAGYARSLGRQYTGKGEVDVEDR